MGEEVSSRCSLMNRGRTEKGEKLLIMKLLVLSMGKRDVQLSNCRERDNLCHSLRFLTTLPQNAGAGANKILSDFQSQELRKELQAWCNFVARR